MTPEEFNDAYALCQFLPGPNVVNLSVVFGRRIRGAVGSAAAVGLVMGTCAKMALPLFKDPLGIAPLLALATLVSVGVLRWPLYWALGGLIPLSIAIAWVRR